MVALMFVVKIDMTFIELHSDLCVYVDSIYSNPCDYMTFSLDKKKKLFIQHARTYKHIILLAACAYTF